MANSPPLPVHGNGEHVFHLLVTAGKEHDRRLAIVEAVVLETIDAEAIIVTVIKNCPGSSGRRLEVQLDEEQKGNFKTKSRFQLQNFLSSKFIFKEKFKQKLYFNFLNFKLYVRNKSKL